MKNLTLIIPAKYEAETLPIFLEEIKNLGTKIKIVLEENDKKTIDSINSLENIEIQFQKKRGYGAAIIEGINECDTEYCCIINADGSMDPKYLSEMLTLCKNKDLVFCSRYEKYAGSDDDTLITLIGNKIFTFLGNLLFKLNITDILFTYIIGKTKSFKDLKLSYLDFRLCVEIPIKAKKKSYEYICLASRERSRIGGIKKVNALKDGFLILIGLISFLFKKI
jgi:glycosyltransferase involved in cell wall biosynthesis